MDGTVYLREAYEEGNHCFANTLVRVEKLNKVKGAVEISQKNIPTFRGVKVLTLTLLCQMTFLQSENIT